MFQLLNFSILSPNLVIHLHPLLIKPKLQRIHFSLDPPLISLELSIQLLQLLKRFIHKEIPTFLKLIQIGPPNIFKPSHRILLLLIRNIKIRFPLPLLNIAHNTQFHGLLLQLHFQLLILLLQPKNLLLPPLSLLLHFLHFSHQYFYPLFNTLFVYDSITISPLLLGQGFQFGYLCVDLF